MPLPGRITKIKVSHLAIIFLVAAGYIVLSPVATEANPYLPKPGEAPTAVRVGTCAFKPRCTTVSLTNTGSKSNTSSCEAVL